MWKPLKRLKESLPWLWLMGVRGQHAILSNVLFVNKNTGAVFKVNLLAAITNLILNIILFSMFKNIVIAGSTT